MVRDDCSGLSQKRGSLGKIISWFSSLTVTVYLLLWIAGICIIATVTPQHDAFPLKSGISLSERFVRFMHINDIYHSFWLMAPLALLALNLIACIWLRMNYLKKRKPGDQVLQKKTLRGTGLFMVHASIVLILLGAGIGLFGMRGVLEIQEGAVTDRARLDDGTEIKLPFALRCDGFTVEYYNNGMPKEYRSEVSFLQKNSPEVKASILVNHPARFAGIMFSQSGFHPFLSATIGVDSGKEKSHAVVEEDNFFLLRGNDCQVRVVRLMDNVMNMGPAAELMIKTPEGERTLWLFMYIDRILVKYPGIIERHPEFDPSNVKPYTLSLVNMSRRYTTVLSLNKDPGTMIVGMGGVLLLIGLMFIFFVQRERRSSTSEENKDL